MRNIPPYIYIVLILILLGGGFFVWHRYASNNTFNTSASSVSANEEISSTTPAASGMTRFYDQPHHFTLEYPNNLQVTEFPDAGNSLTVAFKDPTTGEGFQVFAVPYDDQKITEQRFLLDDPSGVMQSPQNITIDGAAATEFYSTSQAMGDTQEIWFLNNGILYEVTTYKELDTWLAPILQTWNFVN